MAAYVKRLNWRSILPVALLMALFLIVYAQVMPLITSFVHFPLIVMVVFGGISLINLYQEYSEWQRMKYLSMYEPGISLRIPLGWFLYVVFELLVLHVKL